MEWAGVAAWRALMGVQWAGVGRSGGVSVARGVESPARKYAGEQKEAGASKGGPARLGGSREEGGGRLRRWGQQSRAGSGQVNTGAIMCSSSRSGATIGSEAEGFAAHNAS